jgi:hypothetical protein
MEHFAKPVRCRRPGCRAAIRRALVQGSAGQQQLGDTIHKALLRRDQQRRAPVGAQCVHVGAGLEQHVCRIQPAELVGSVQGHAPVQAGAQVRPGAQ